MPFIIHVTSIVMYFLVPASLPQQPIQVSWLIVNNTRRSLFLLEQQSWLAVWKSNVSVFRLVKSTIVSHQIMMNETVHKMHVTIWARLLSCFHGSALFFLSSQAMERMMRRRKEKMVVVGLRRTNLLCAKLSGATSSSGRCLMYPSDTWDLL